MTLHQTTWAIKIITLFVAIWAQGILLGQSTVTTTLLSIPFTQVPNGTVLSLPASGNHIANTNTWGGIRTYPQGGLYGSTLVHTGGTVTVVIIKPAGSYTGGSASFIMTNSSGTEVFRYAASGASFAGVTSQVLNLAAGNYSISGLVTSPLFAPGGFEAYLILPDTSPQTTVTVSPTAATLVVGSSRTFTTGGGSGTGVFNWGGEGSGTGTSKTITFNTIGTSTVTVSKAASTGFFVSNTATSTITVLSNLNIISNSTQNYLSSQTLSTTGGPATGTTTYSIVNSSSPGAGTISGATLTANTGTGWVDVRAAKAGIDSNIVRINFSKISQSALTLSPNIPHQFNVTRTYTAAGGNSTAPITDTVFGLGVLRQGPFVYKALLGLGGYQVNLTKAADDNYLERTDSIPVALTTVGSDDLTVLSFCSTKVTMSALGGNGILVNNLLFQSNSTTGNGTQYRMTVTRLGLPIGGYVSSIEIGGYSYSNPTGTAATIKGPNGVTRVTPFYLSELPTSEVTQLKSSATAIIITYTFNAPQILGGNVNTYLDGSIIQSMAQLLSLSPCAEAYATPTPAVHEFRLLADTRNYPHSPRPAVLRWNAGIPVDIQVLKTLTDPNGVVVARGLSPTAAQLNLTGPGAIIDDFTIENIVVSRLTSTGTLTPVSATGLISLNPDLRSIVFTPPAANPKGYGLYYVTYDVRDRRTSSSFSLPSRLIIYDNELPVPDPMAGGATTRFSSTLPSSVQIGEVTSVPISTLQNVTRNDVLPDGTTINGLSAYYIFRTTACFFVHGNTGKTANMFITNMGGLTGETTSSSLANCGSVTANAYSPVSTSTNGFAGCLNGGSFYYTRLPVTISVQTFTPSSNFASEIGKRVVMASSGSVKCVRIACP